METVSVIVHPMALMYLLNTSKINFTWGKDFIFPQECGREVLLTQVLVVPPLMALAEDFPDSLDRYPT